MPAQVSTGKIIRVFYYAKTADGKPKRYVTKCNRGRNKAECLKRARMIAAELNLKLELGWSLECQIDIKNATFGRLEDDDTLQFLGLDQFNDGIVTRFGFDDVWRRHDAGKYVLKVG